MKWKNVRLTLLAFFLFTAVQFVSAGEPLQDEFIYGLDLFKVAQYEQSARLFQTVLDDPGSEKLHGEAQYWLARCYLERKDLNMASRLIEDFLIKYPGHSLNTDARYYKGRILFLQEEYDKTIHYYSSFLTSFPHTPYSASSLYWIGESLYSLGRFEEAREIYSSLQDQYPRSIKIEAAHYKLSLIEFRSREEELLKLLQWSHEEFLKSSGEYEQKEKEFNQALAVYQNKLIELTKTKEVYDNRLRLLKLKEESLMLKERLMNSQAGGSSDE